MDPNVILAEVINQIRNFDSDGGIEADDFVEDVRSLLEWLAMGGFAPKWEHI